MAFKFESFPTIGKLLNTINSRPQSEYMEGCNSSQKPNDNKNWSGTKTYEDAIRLLINGDVEKLQNVKTIIKQNNQILFQSTRKIKNMPIGFIPNVPNTLQNKPDSMINIIKKPQKQKTLRVFYSMDCNCNTESQDILKAGAVLVSVLNLIENYGIQTKLSTSIYTGNAGEEIICSMLDVKNYGERFNLQKICFPLINPAIFRRIGFKYLETCPLISTSNFSWGYGAALSDKCFREKIEEYFQNKIETPKCITAIGIIENNYDFNYILKTLGIIKGE